MKYNKVINSNQEFNLENAKLLVNIVTGSLVLNVPLISIGMSSFQIDTSLVYNAHFKNYNFDRNIGFNNGYKLNLEQHLFLYKQEYNLDGFEEGDYVYIDELFNIHRFVKYVNGKDTNNYVNMYYDESQYGLTLKIQNNEYIITDLYKNIYQFTNGYLTQVVSSVNNQIKKKIEYQNGKIVSVYDTRKPYRTISFVYDNSGNLIKTTTNFKNINYDFKYKEEKLVDIIKYNEIDKIKLLHIDYENNEIQQLVNPNKLTGIYINYINNKVSEVSDGIFVKNITYQNTSELYLDNNEYVKDSNYVTNSHKTINKYEYLFKDKLNYKYGLNENNNYTLNETNIEEDYLNEKLTIEYVTNNSTILTNKKGISVVYYFNDDGSLASNLEINKNNVNANVNAYYTTYRSKGFDLTISGFGKNQINNKRAITVNSKNNLFEYDVPEYILNNFKEEKIEEGTITPCTITLWVKLSKNIKTDGILKVEYMEGEYKHVAKAVLKSTNSEIIQQAQLSVFLSKNLNSMKIFLTDENNSYGNEIIDMKIEKGTTMMPVVFIPLGDYLSKCYLHQLAHISFRDIEKDKAVYYNLSNEFYISESDLINTYRNYYFAKKAASDEKTVKFDLVYCNGTKVKLISSLKFEFDTIGGILDIWCMIDESDKPNFMLRAINLVKGKIWHINESNVTIHYDETSNKYYYETTTAFGVYASINDDSINDYSEKNFKTYNWQYEDGRKMGEQKFVDYRDEDQHLKIHNIRTMYSYDNFGNVIEETTINNEESSDERLSIFYFYEYGVSDSSHEAVGKIVFNDNIQDIIHNNDLTINKVKVGNLETKYIYDSFGEKVIQVKFIDPNSNEEQIKEFNNNIIYNKNNEISTLKDNSNCYSFRNYKYNHLQEIYDHNIKLLKNENKLSSINDINISTIYKDVNEILIYKTEYDEYGRIIKVKINNDEVTYIYENNNDLSPRLCNVLKVLLNGTVFEEYEYDDETGQITTKKVNNNNLINDSELSINFQIKTDSSGNKEYSFSQNENITKLIIDKSSCGLINSVNNKSNFQSDNSTEFTEKILAELSYDYDYDKLGKLNKKSGCIVMDNYAERSFFSTYTKEIIYKPNTNLPSTIIHNVLAHRVLTAEENENEKVNATFEYQCEYDELTNNITSINEVGSRLTSEESQENNSINVLVYADSGNGLKTTYEYDIFNRIKRENNVHMGLLNYIYDESTNMLGEISQTTIFNRDFNDVTIKKFEYGFEGKHKNRLTKYIKYDIINNNTAISEKESIIEYDEYGNMTKIGDHILTYNNMNLLSQYKINDNNIINYEYNPLGQRIRKYKSGRITKYYVDGGNIVGEDIYTDGKLHKIKYFYDAEGICGLNYVYGLETDRLLIDEAKTFTLIKDPLGNVSKVMYKGKIIGEYFYDAWGNCDMEIYFGYYEKNYQLFLNVMLNNPFRYKGYYYDVEIGLFYCNSRYYSPELCRWISPDTIDYLAPESINGLNLYCYCKNNPVM